MNKHEKAAKFLLNCNPSALTPADIRTIGSGFCNWGKWGADDQKGTLNFITPELRMRALATPTLGETFSLCIDLDDTGPWPAHLGGPRFNPRHTMTVSGHGQCRPGGFVYTDDSLEMPLQAATQWDALAHVFYDGQMYNGRGLSEITSAGAQFNGIDRVRAQILGRGVLLDVARHVGVDCLSDETAIGPDLLTACAERQQTNIGIGDILLVRTGRVGRAKREKWKDFAKNSAGISVRCAAWFHERQIAAVAADNIAVEPLPPEVPACHMALHMICMRDMGMMFGEIWDLDVLAGRCAEIGRYEFLLSAQPLPVTGGVGSVVNPLAML